MPYYSELGIYTPSSSYTSPLLLKGPYSAHSSILASNILPPSSKQFNRANFRSFKPHLTTISESGLGAPIRRLNSPKVLYHSSPKVRTPRPVKISTADIELSLNKYNKYNQQPPKPSSNTEIARQKEPSPRLEKDAKPNTNIRRDRVTIRLQTIHKDTLEKEIGQIRSWRDNFKPEELVTEAKRRKKTPGEILKEKFLIRSKSKDNIAQLDPPKITRKASIKKSPSFKDICDEITSDQVTEDLNPGQPIEIRRRQSRQLSHDDILKEIKRSSSTLSVEEVQILDALLQAEHEAGLFESPPIIDKKSKVKKKRATKNKTGEILEVNNNNAILEVAPTSKLRKASSLKNMVKDISQVEIEMIPAKQKPIITGSVGTIEEKPSNNLKAVVEDLEIQESPRQEKKFRFNVTVQEFPVEKKINAPKHILKKSNYGIAHVPLSKASVVTSILKKREHTQIGQLISDCKVKEKKLVKSLSDVKVQDKPKLLLKSDSIDSVHNFTVTVGKALPVEEENNSGSSSPQGSGKLKIMSIEKSLDGKSKQANISKNNEDLHTNSSYKANTVLKSVKQDLKADTFLLKNQFYPTKLAIEPIKAPKYANPKKENIYLLTHSLPKAQVAMVSKITAPLTQNAKKDIIGKLTIIRVSHNVPLLKSQIVPIKSSIAQNALIDTVAQDIITEKVTTKEEMETKIIENRDNNKVNDNIYKNKEAGKDLLKQKSKKILNLSKDIKDYKEVLPVKEAVTTKNSEEKLKGEKIIVKKSTKASPEKGKLLEKSLETQNGESSFWDSMETEKYEPPKLGKFNLKITDPKALLKEIQECHKDLETENPPETPEEKEKRMISKRSLIQKANKSDPDLRVFEPPTPPEPEKDPPPEPSFVPLQSNRLSQWMHPWKKPQQMGECPVEIFAKPKFIRARHIPRRWRHDGDIQCDSEDSTTSEDDSSEESSEEENEDEESDVIGGHNMVGASTSSTDSGFDSGRTKNKECDVNCHKKCQKLMANLCGVNQKLVVEAIEKVKVRKGSIDSRDSSGNTLNPALNPAFALDFSDLPEEVCHSSTYQGFQKSGRITPPATTIPRFKKYCVEDFNFLKVLGKGSFGKVLLAELKGTEYYYAIKCLKKDVVLEDDDVECTLIERKVLALGTKHPYLCHLLCTFQTESHLFFVMEYLNGGDLMFHIQAERRFSEVRARFYGAEIVSGLKFLHNKGIVYRDLKLDNILLDFDGHVRIADFGMCKLQIFLDRMADTFCGTPDYMAPEIIKGQHYNQCVDWWSFGVLLYEMLLGQSPFSGSDEDELFWSICNEKPVIPKFLSTEAGSVLLQFLEKDANKRLGNRFSPHGDIQDHAFFQPIDWQALEARRLEPPFKPYLQHPLDTQYFDKTFTVERAKLTPIESGILQSMDQTQFQGFSYTNPNATDK